MQCLQQWLHRMIYYNRGQVVRDYITWPLPPPTVYLLPTPPTPTTSPSPPTPTTPPPHLQHPLHPSAPARAPVASCAPGSITCHWALLSISGVLYVHGMSEPVFSQAVRNMFYHRGGYVKDNLNNFKLNLPVFVRWCMSVCTYVYEYTFIYKHILYIICMYFISHINTYI